MVFSSLKAALERMFNVDIDQMSYNSLVHAIPSKWIKALKGKSCNPTMGDNISLSINGKLKTMKDITCKDIYWEYIRRIGETPKSEDKWHKYLDKLHIDWQDHYHIPYTVCRETTIQSFQYKSF